MRRVIFLLGAGTSVNAGMPTVSALTHKLRKQLPKFRDVNGRKRPEFSKLFNRVCSYDPEVLVNYERFFEWVEFLLKTRREPFMCVTDLKIGRKLVETAGHFAFVIRGHIFRVLTSSKARPGYLSRIRDFIPKRGRLHVFTLNYDSCIEDVCAANNIYVTTGFDPITKRWKPHLFDEISRGINLYKLHGSLRWFGTTNSSALARGMWTNSYYFLELKPKDRTALPSTLDVSNEPTLILGPAPKLQSDDPFLTLFYKFHRILRRAKVCVVIGYGFRDEHINEKLDEAVKLGSHVVNVGPDDPPSRYLSSCRFHHLKMSAKDAFLKGHIKKKLVKLGI